MPNTAGRFTFKGLIMNADMKLQQAYLNLIAAIAYHDFCLRACYSQNPIDAAAKAWEEADTAYCNAEIEYIASRKDSK